MCILKDLIALLKPSLPHPCEKPDFSRTIGNTRMASICGAWLEGWAVDDPDFWLNEVTIELSIKYPTPGLSFSEDKKIILRPEWANPGTLAHEAAHVSYSLLSDTGKSNFEFQYYACRDGLLTYLQSKVPYMHTNIVEAHAEIYRYLGQKMPVELRDFYLKLIGKGGIATTNPLVLGLTDAWNG